MSKRRNNRGGSSAAKARTTDKVIRAIALLLVLIAAAYVITSLVLKEWNPVKWVKSGDVATEEPDKTEVIAITSEGKKFLTSNSYIMPRAMSMVNKQSTYSKSPTFNVTAELSNQYINGRFDWAVEFVNPSDSWAVGKVAEYYVQAIPTTDGSATATIKYISTFNSQIKVTATLRGSDSSDSCTIDCIKQMQMTECWTDVCDFGDYIDGGCTLTGTDGTVFPDYEVSYAYLVADFRETVQRYLKFNIDIQDFELTGLINKKPLNIEERSNTHLQLAFTAGKGLEYSDFIDNFDAFDDEHKEAVYYAWYRAAIDCKDGVQFELGLKTSVNGIETGNTVIGATCKNAIVGSSYGADVKPSVTLNQNIVF